MMVAAKVLATGAVIAKRQQGSSTAVAVASLNQDTAAGTVEIVSR